MKTKIKYGYNNQTGLVYRQVEGKPVQFMCAGKAYWITMCAGDVYWMTSSIFNDMNKMSSISSSVVHYFEKQGGYIPSFRELG